jgi:putative hemolysin
VLAGVLATASVVTLITLSTILFGELVPKRIGQIYPETAARMTAPLMLALSWMARPLVNALSWSTAAILRLMRIDLEKVRQVTEEEITASLEDGVSAGLIEEHEHQMVQNVFLLDDRLLTSLMLPRSEIQWLDANDTLTQAIAKASVTGHSWYPVCRGSLDEVMGVVKSSDMLAQSHADANAAVVQEKRVADCTLPAVFSPCRAPRFRTCFQPRPPCTHLRASNLPCPDAPGRLVWISWTRSGLRKVAFTATGQTIIWTWNTLFTGCSPSAT